MVDMISLSLFERVRDISLRRGFYPSLTPSILARWRPLAGSVRMTSAPRVVARMWTPLSIETEPPVKMGRIILQFSKAVWAARFVVIMVVMIDKRE